MKTYDLDNSNLFINLLPNTYFKKFIDFTVKNDLALLENNKYVLSSLTWMMGLCMNLISKIHHSYEKGNKHLLYSEENTE